MDINLLKERETPLLSRKRCTLDVHFKGATPSRKQIRDEIAKKLKADPELTVVRHIYTRHGVEKARVITNIYTKKEDMVKFEDKGLLEKHSEKKEEKAEEKKA
ncbi:hypothetical protein HZB90_00280 [archaeon]|nr:hypothetical protein [archaeon]